MNRKFAQYLTCLIARDLDEAYNGKGLPSFICELIENCFTNGQFEEIEEFLEERKKEILKEVNKMKPLTLEETRLKEQMKERCLAKGQYIDENAKAKFDMLCHLEDFEVQYWELQQENKQYKEVIDKVIEYEEEIMYLANKVAVTTQNVEIKAIRDRLEEIFEILKEVE